MRIEENDLDRSNLIRHCPDYKCNGGKPTYKAFRLRSNKNEPYLSFYCLEKICRDAGHLVDCRRGIETLEEAPPLGIKIGDVWVVFPIEELKLAVKKVTSKLPDVFFAPEDGPPYHVGVEWEDKKLHNKVAKEIAARVKEDYIYSINQDKESAFRRSRDLP